MDNETKILKEVENIKKETTLEKHIQTILLSVTTAAIIGGFVVITTIRESLVRMEERDKIRSEMITDMQVSLKALQFDITDLKQRVTRFETQNNK